MNEASLARWLEELIAMASEVAAELASDEVQEWRTNCNTAMANFPVGSGLRTTWEEVRTRYEEAHTGSAARYVLKRELGVLRAALGQIQDGRLGQLLDGVRLETISEVLEQADELCNSNHLVAAMVLAGGALETRLRELCDAHGLTWQGSGSIDKYKGALDQARKAGNAVVSQSDGKQITAWGGLRNDAAHRPAEFNKTRAEVATVIEGIRQFLARTA